MADSASVLDFLSGYNSDEEEEQTTTVQPEQTAPSADSGSVLNFLKSYTGDTTVKPNEDAKLTAPPQEIGDTDWLVPVADDPSKEYIEPVYEYEEGERLADVNDSITMMDNFFARSDELERKVKEGTATEEEQQELKESGTRAEYEEEVREYVETTCL